MTGLPDNNYPVFNTVADMLREMNFQIYNPAEWEDRYNDGKFNVQFAFADYSTYICREADAVVVLKGWQKSVGANAEVALARAVQKPVYDAYQLMYNQKFVNV